jgi:glycerol-3-phosphate O-acyltransferase
MGNRVMDEINRVTAVTPGSLTALVLLCHRQRGLSHEELLARAEKLLGVIDRWGARVSPALRTSSGVMRPESLRESVQMFADSELVEIHEPSQLPAPDGRRRSPRAGPGAYYVVSDAKRLSLDTSKNVIVHFFVERALVALALLGANPPAGIDGVRERVRELSRLFKLEFRFRADQPFDVIFAETCRSMAESGELDLADGACLAGAGHDGWSGREWLECYAGILVSFLEAYLVAARALRYLQKGPVGEKELLKRALGLGGEMFLAGEIERREAVSKPLLQNAFQAFTEQGLIAHRESYEPVADEARLDELSRTLLGYLPARRP